MLALIPASGIEAISPPGTCGCQLFLGPSFMRAMYINLKAGAPATDLSLYETKICARKLRLLLDIIDI